ncbi:MAG: DUF6291 domain-containing protein [Flavobacterium sp.]|jgi:hypothetical protein
MRDSMIIYRSFYEAIKPLPKEDQAEVWDAVFSYGLDKKEPNLKGVAKSIFTLIKPQLDANFKRYLNGTKTKQKQSKDEAKNKQVQSKSVTNVNDNVNVNVNLNKNDNDKQPLRQPKIDINGFVILD